MQKILIIISLFLLIFILGCGEKSTTSKKADQPKPALTLPADLPEIGTKMKLDGVNWTVVARGVKPFEFTSTGESLGLLPHKSEKMVAVIAEEKGVVIKIDPTVPSVTANGESKFPSLKEYCQPGAFLLLEYDRAGN